MTWGLFGAILIASASLKAQTAVSVDDYRPLAAAADKLEGIMGIPINYDDVPYQNRADLVDVSTAQQRLQYPSYHLWVPRPGAVTGTVDKGQTPAVNIALLLASYRSSKLPGDFTVEEENGAIYITASKVLTASGSIVEVVSPLKANVSVPYATRTVLDTLLMILKSVAGSTGIHIELGAAPFLPTETISYGSAPAEARKVLGDILAKAPSPLSYRLGYDPLTGYMLNIKVVQGGVRPPTANATANAPAGNPPGESGFGPGFIKK